MPLMLPHAPQFSRYESNGSATPTATPGTAINHPAGAAHTKDTTFTELIASSAFDTQLVVITASGNNGGNTNTDTLLDIAIGASTAESVVIPDLTAGWAGTTAVVGGVKQWWFPLRIPAGSRISGRTQSVRTTGSVTVLVELYGGPLHPDLWWAGSQVTAYGINAAGSRGTAVTAGNTGAETASPVSIGTTSAAHEVLVVGVQGRSGGTGTLSALHYHFDVGIDTSSTEWLIRDAFRFHTTSAEIVGGAGEAWHPIRRHIPSGTVLVMGGECSGTAEGLTFALYGVS